MSEVLAEFTAHRLELIICARPSNCYLTAVKTTTFLHAAKMIIIMIPSHTKEWSFIFILKHFIQSSKLKETYKLKYYLAGKRIKGI